jgi:hypothetical protein
MARGAMTAIWLALAACTGGPAASPSSARRVCDASAAEARRRVTSVIPAHKACRADTDCQAVMVIASCFNECAAAVNLAGAGAVDRASTLVEAHECKVFAEAGCAPPAKQCEPPKKPVCESQQCRF